jgi:hypothetical protein
MNCNIVEIKDIKIISRKLLIKLYNMYELSYSGAGQELWFRTPDDLQRYNCGIILSCVNNLDYEESYINAYLLYQFRTYANKISLGCHDGTPEGKENAMKLRNDYLRTPGFVLEAKDAVSWLLRKKYSCPYFTNIDIIKQILDIKEDGNERIRLNENFDPLDKGQQFYFHEYLIDGVVQYSNPETLFGTSLCEFEGTDCNRKCIINDLIGGKYYLYKLKINYSR